MEFETYLLHLAVRSSRNYQLSYNKKPHSGLRNGVLLLPLLLVSDKSLLA